MRALVLLAALCLAAPCLAACEASEPAASTRVTAPEPASLEAFFPSAVGDRWRERVGDAARTRGVTAITPQGLRVVFGTAARRPAFHRVSAEEIALATPEGRVIEPLLRAPLELGARFSYTLGEGPAAARCEATITADRVTYPVGPLTSCVELARRCRHPAGGPFRVPTLREAEEVWCPRVGRVRTTTRLDPPIDGASAPPELRVVHYAVAGAPALAPDRFDCDALPLLASDVAAACGPRWTWAGEEAGPQSCTVRFAAGADRLEIRVTRREDEARAEAVAEATRQAFGGEPAAVDGAFARVRDGRALVDASEGRQAIFVEASGCEPARLARLAPLVRSIVR